MEVGAEGGREGGEVGEVGRELLLSHTFNAIELANTITGLSKLGAHPEENP